MTMSRNWPNILLIFILISFGLCGLLDSGQWWGFNYAGFLSYIFLIGYIAVVCAVLLLSLGVVSESSVEGILAPLASIIFDTGRQGRLMISLAVIVPLFILQTSTHLLGDGYGWLGIFSQGESYIHKWTEPFSILIIRAIQNLTGKYTIESATSAFRTVSILSGGIFVWSAIGIAAELTTDLGKRLLILSTLIFSGAIVLFCGYIEFYAPLWATTALWFYIALRYLNHRANWVAAIVTYLIAVSIHLAALIFFPALLVLFVTRIQSNQVRKVGYTVVGVLALVAASLVVWLYSTRIEIEVLILPLFNGRPQAPDYAVFSLAHFFDIVNLALLVFPALPVLIYWQIRSRLHVTNDGTRYFLMTLAAGGIIFLLFFGAGITMARDWDIMSITLLPIALFLLYAIAKSEFKIGATTVVNYVLVTLLVSGAFVAVNANTKASEERFETLLNDRQRSGWVIFADYLERTGQTDKRKTIVEEMNRRFPDHVDLQRAYAFIEENQVTKAVQIAERLVDHDPYQAEFLQLLANVREKQRNFAEASDLFERALRLQPYRAEIMNEYGQLLMTMKEYDAALPILKKARAIKSGLTFIAESLALDYIYLKDYDAADAVADTLFEMQENSPGAHLIKLTIALNKGERVKAMIHYSEFVEHGQGRSDYETMKKYYDYLAR